MRDIFENFLTALKIFSNFFQLISFTGVSFLKSFYFQCYSDRLLAKAKNKTTAMVTQSINQRMLPIAESVLTITLDNGKEFSQHECLSDRLNADIFFAKPYHSWERGLNENTNGLVRQYFPKRIPFDNITEHELQSVARKINNRPRKCLGYKTPFEVFSRACERRGIALRS